ncbi:hypothetical protein B0T26DRAFT_770140, partial [Lasiosphaeria miniovina]
GLPPRLPPSRPRPRPRLRLRPPPPLRPPLRPRPPPPSRGPRRRSGPGRQLRTRRSRCRWRSRRIPCSRRGLVRHGRAPAAARRAPRCRRRAHVPRRLRPAGCCGASSASDRRADYCCYHPGYDVLPRRCRPALRPRERAARLLRAVGNKQGGFFQGDGREGKEGKALEYTGTQHIRCCSLGSPFLSLIGCPADKLRWRPLVEYRGRELVSFVFFFPLSTMHKHANTQPRAKRERPFFFNDTHIMRGRKRRREREAEKGGAWPVWFSCLLGIALAKYR